MSENEDCEGCGAPLVGKLKCEYCLRISPRAHPATACDPQWMAAMQMQNLASYGNLMQSAQPGLANAANQYHAYSSQAQAAANTIMGLMLL